MPGLYIYPLALKHLRMILPGVFFPLHVYCFCPFASLDFTAYCTHTRFTHEYIRAVLGEMQSHISLSICAYAVCRISNSRNPAEAFPLGNSSSLILFPDFISGETLPILFHSIQYIYPDTDFNSDSTSTPTFRGAIHEISPMP